MAGTNLSASTVLEMIYGHWRSQHLYAGVELGGTKLAPNLLCSVDCFVHSPVSTPMRGA
jgi:hypothetical protein